MKKKFRKRSHGKEAMEKKPWKRSYGIGITKKRVVEGIMDKALRKKELLKALRKRSQEKKLRKKELLKTLRKGVTEKQLWKRG